MATMFGMFPFLLKLYADGGYQGPLFRAALKKIMAQVNVEIVKRSGQVKAFVVLPRRWVVERFFAWVQWQRRILVRWEYYPQNFLGFVQLACLLILFKRF